MLWYDYCNMLQPYKNNEYTSSSDNIMFIAKRGHREKAEAYVKHYQGHWINKSRTNPIFQLPNGIMYSVVYPSETNTKKFKPRRVLIEAEINFHILEDRIQYCCQPLCHRVEFF